MANDGLDRRQGALCRGSRLAKELALAFTGDEYGEGLETILDELGRRGLKGAFFFTGRFFEIEAHQPLIRRLVREGHYLGPHSDRHLLLAGWEEGRTLVTREEFEADLRRNLERCAEFGFPLERIRYWIPPYEHLNLEVCSWSLEAGVVPINFTPGTLSFTDYAPEGDRAFRPTSEILQSVFDYPKKDPHGFKGFILLFHAGSGPRADKLHPRFGEVLDFLLGEGYAVVRVDELLDKGLSMGG